MSDVRVEGARLDYARHVAELRPHLPPGVLPLARADEPISMHDGHFISVQAPYAVAGRLIFDIACWDMAHGALRDNVWTYPDLHVRIVYDDAELLRPQTLSLFDRRARNASTVVLYDEFDRSADGDAFEHRMPELRGPEDGLPSNLDLAELFFEECYDQAGLRIWTTKRSESQLVGQLNLDEINSKLPAVRLPPLPKGAKSGS